ncbi:MAG TPA: hypothetical protein VJI13_00330 [Candidatus Norongarragalinales archaeon]|nr:hypothetical protein [Candidatus Norongarragalinales archaeon]
MLLKMLFAVALLACTCDALPEFSHLFETRPSAVLLPLVAFPESCSPLNFEFEFLDRSDLPMDAPLAISYYEQARQNFLSARAVSRYGSSPLVTPGQMEHAASIICHQYALDSLNHASLAMAAIFSHIDSKSGDLDMVQGDEDGFAAGLLEEKAAFEEDLKSKQPRSPLSSKVLAAASGLAKVWSDFPNLRGNSAYFYLVLGKGGAVHEASIFARRLGGAAKQLEFFNLNLSRQYVPALYSGEEAIAEIKRRKIGEVSRNILYLAPESKLNAADSASFFDEALELEAMVKRAKSFRADSERAISSKERGYLAYSVLQLSNAQKALSEVVGRAERLLARSESLEVALADLQGKMEGSVADAIDGKKGQPLAHSFLTRKFGEFRKERDRYDESDPIGDRINFQAKLIRNLAVILDEAAATDTAALKLTKLKGNVQGLDSTISKAKQDGLDVFGEESAAMALKASLTEMDFTSDLGLLEQLEGQQKQVEESIIEKATEKFGHLSKDYYELNGMAEYLSPESRIILEGFADFFDAGQLDAGSNLGRLSDLEKFIVRESEKLDAQKPKIISEHLLSTMAITEISDPAPPDTQTMFTAYVSFENLLGFNANNVKVPLALPLGSVLLNATSGLSLARENGKLFLAIGEPAPVYFAVLQFEAIANSILSSDAAVEVANQDEVRLRKTVKFRTSRSSNPLIIFDAPSALAAVEYAGRYESSIADHLLTIVPEAFPGDNALSAIFTIQDPFSLSQKAIGKSNSSLTIEFDYANIALDLPHAEIEYRSLGECDISKILVLQSDFQFTDSSKGNYLVFSLKAGEWPQGLEKKLTLKLICNNPISELLERELMSINSSGSLSDMLSIQKTRQSLDEGNYLKALENLQLAGEYSDSSFNFNEKAALLRIAALFMHERGYEVQFGLELEGLIMHSEALAEGNDFDGAISALASAEKDLKSMLEAKLALARTRCNSGCRSELLDKLKSLSVGILSRSYADALLAAMEFDTGMQEDYNASALKAREKADAIAGYADLALRSQDALSDFAIFFQPEINAGNGVGSNTAYKSGLAAKTSLEKLMRDLSQINNAVEVGDAEKYSANMISETMDSGEGALLALITANAKIRDMARSELDGANRRQEQFGGANGAGEALEKAKGEFDSGHFFTAYLLASELSTGLMPAANAKSQDLSLLAVPAIAVLLGLSYFLLFGKKSAQSPKINDSG